MPQPNFQQQQQQQANMANNPNIMQRMPHQAPPGMNNLNQGGNFPGNQQRMPFTQGSNQQNQMVVGQSGPSPGSGGMVSNPGLSPFGPNSSGMTPPNSTAVVSQQNAQQMLSNRPIMSPSNDFNPNMILKQQQQQQSMNSQAPSPFNSNQNNQNVFNNNIMMQNNQRMMPPTPTSDMIPVPSPSPSLNSNNPPPPVSTPNTPIVTSLFNRPQPTPPPMMPQSSPSHAGKGQNFGNSMSGGKMTNSNASGQGKFLLNYLK